MANLTMNILQYVFPCDTVWSFNASEIVGYSVGKNLHFVIEDGMCSSTDGYVLSVYKPTDREHYINWLPTKKWAYCKKYLDDEKLIEERVNFESVQERVNYKSKLESL